MKFLHQGAFCRTSSQDTYYREESETRRVKFSCPWVYAVFLDGRDYGTEVVVLSFCHLTLFITFEFKHMYFKITIHHAKQHDLLHQSLMVGIYGRNYGNSWKESLFHLSSSWCHLNWRYSSIAFTDVKVHPPLHGFMNTRWAFFWMIAQSNNGNPLRSLREDGVEFMISGLPFTQPTRIHKLRDNRTLIRFLIWVNARGPPHL